MSQVDLTVEKRDKTTKSHIKTLRKSGVIPGVVIHKGDASVSVQVSDKALSKALHTDAGRNVLINLKLENDKSRKKRTVVVKELQHHPVSGNIVHIDFHQISLTEKITVNVPIIEKGEAPGVKNEGGVLDIPLREIIVECLPTDIPEHFDVDISQLTLNKAIHVSDLSLPPNVVIKNDPGMVIIQVVPPKVEKEEPAEDEAPAEPEVIGAKKDEEEGEGEGEASAKPEAKAAESKDKEAKKEAKKDGA